MIRVSLGVTVLARGAATNSIDGIGTYTSALWSGLSRRKDVQCTAISYGWPIPSSVEGSYGLEIRSSYTILVARSALCGIAFPKGKRIAERSDVIHAADHLIPKYRGVPIIGTIMDAIPLSHPEWFADPWRDIKNAAWRRSARWLDRIITISDYSKNEIVNQFNVPRNRVDVVPLGVDRCWFAPVASDEVQNVRENYGLPDRYYLFVGTLQPRKNLKRVIEAFRMLPQGLSSHCPLIIVGAAGKHEEHLVAHLKELRSGDDVRWLGRVPDKDLLPIVKSACALVFPSLCEGFGLPVLEAFAAGVPVIASNSSALPEVVSDAGLLVDPMRVDEIAESMSRIVSDDVLANSLMEKGRERAAEFTWDRTISSTINVYKNVI